MASRIDAFVREVQAELAKRAGLDAKMAFAGILNQYLPTNEKAVLVGGSLVEFYTDGAVASKDIDLVGPRDRVVALIEAAGFVKGGRTWFSKDLDLVVDVAGNQVGKGESIRTLRYGGWTIPAVSLEDALVDRLCAAEFWKREDDWEKAILLYDLNRGRFDVARLKTRAAEERVSERLQLLLDQIS